MMKYFCGSLELKRGDRFFHFFFHCILETKCFDMLSSEGCEVAEYWKKCTYICVVENIRTSGEKKQGSCMYDLVETWKRQAMRVLTLPVYETSRSSLLPSQVG